MKQVLAITRKELRGYFGSPLAVIFIGAFLAATLFTFFWVATFFARGIADVRPLFQWTPVLLIFLVAALTMRQWSEEQRVGTLEVLLTLPVSPVQLVIGKFLAVVALVVLALALTFSLPLTVALFGNLDWGPVIGGYLASVLLAGVYAAIGLAVSSRTDNQIVALISTVLICGVLYLVGSAGVTDFVGQQTGEILRAIGVGSRFESIQRGVVDFRDLLYYLTLTGIFLALNVLSLRMKSWSHGERTRQQRTSVKLTSGLLIVNLILANIWVYPLNGLRVDLTEQREFSLSQATRDLLENLQEPLLIRGYFSAKTHPLLAPLVPTVRDMLHEYEVASRGKVQLEILDPADDPDKEAEANQLYGITPSPFQVSDRYETSVINAYFDILIRYGDQSQVLNFQDLIDVQQDAGGGVQVFLRNLEYDLTSAIKKTVYGFQSVDAVLASFDKPATLTLYVTESTLPEGLADVPATIQRVAEDMAARSEGKFVFRKVDPTGPDSDMTPDELYETYGVRPYTASLFSSETYYLTMVLEAGDTAKPIYPTGDLGEADIRTTIESGLKRASSGFLKVVGLWVPSTAATTDIYGQTQQPLQSWDALTEALQQEYEVRTLDLSTGEVPADVDVLVLVAPENWSDKESYAVDQYLMRGGAVVVASGMYKLALDPLMGGMIAQPLYNGVTSLLESYGVQVEPALVLDTRNEPFPVAVNREVSGYQVQEIQAIPYPFFVDVRADGMAKGHPIISNLPAVTLNWASPLVVDETKNANREVTVLLQSTAASWKVAGDPTQLGAAPTIVPDLDQYPELGFPLGETRQSYPLAVVIQGSFESAFSGKPSPLATTASPTATTAMTQTMGTITTSSAAARLVVIGSSEFLDDIIFSLSAQLSGERYQNNLKLIQNAIAWATEDLDLLSIRARGTSVRVLAALDDQQRSMVEAANYVVSFLALIVVGVVGSVRRRNEKPMALVPDASLKPRHVADSHTTEVKEVKA